MSDTIKYEENNNIIIKHVDSKNSVSFKIIFDKTTWSMMTHGTRLIDETIERLKIILEEYKKKE